MTSRRSEVRVVVVGDACTGKSSLIVSVATDAFQSRVPPVLPPTSIPPRFYPDRVPLTIVDTSSRPEDKGKLDAECRRADAIVLTYACDRPESFSRLSTYWLLELCQLSVKVPIIVVGCKLDLRNDHQSSLDQMMAPIMQEFKEIETYIECSALKKIQIAEVFYYAQKAVLQPTRPLFDQETQTLKPRCVRALKRVFIACDNDKDGALSDSELNEFQVKCFNARLQPSEIVGVKKVVAEKFPEGVNDNGLTLAGFLFLHALFLERGRLETTWTVLRKFGYDDELKLRNDLLRTPSFKHLPDQSVELTDTATDFLREIFAYYDLDGDGALHPQDVEELFSTAPSSPWEDVVYQDSVEKNSTGALTIKGFLSQWALMTLLDPVRSLAHFIYLGYPGDLTTAFQITRRRSIDRKKQCSLRMVTQCFVFGSIKAGKSALLHCLVGRPFADAYLHTNEEHYVANFVEQLDGSNKVLVLKEIPRDVVSKLLENKDALAACDVAAFVYDSSDEWSLKDVENLLLQVATHGENGGFKVPCLVIAAKDEINSNVAAISSESRRVCQEMCVDAPIAVSMKVGHINNMYACMVYLACHPHLSIPMTEAGKSYQHRKRIVGRSLLALSVGAAVTLVGIAAYRAYLVHRHAHS